MFLLDAVPLTKSAFSTTLLGIVWSALTTALCAKPKSCQILLKFLFSMLNLEISRELFLRNLIFFTWMGIFETLRICREIGRIEFRKSANSRRFPDRNCFSMNGTGNHRFAQAFHHSCKLPREIEILLLSSGFCTGISGWKLDFHCFHCLEGWKFGIKFQIQSSSL